MKNLTLVATCLIALSSLNSAFAIDGKNLPKKKQTQQGLYLTAKQAYKLTEEENKKILFIDVRTRAEVNFLGIPTAADANVPYMKLSEWYSWDKKKNNFKMELNDTFIAQIEKRLADKGLNKNHKIIFMCRSGSRSAAAANVMAKAGYKNVYSIVDGFEGDKAKQGPQKGQRVVNGWKNSNLPWSYKLSFDKMYLSSIE